MEKVRAARRTFVRAVCACATLLLAIPASAQPAVSKEYAVKAAFLYNFTKFVEWPSRCFSKGDAPIVIAVFGPSPFGAELKNAIRSRTLEGRPIVLKEVHTLEEAQATHVLFVPATEDRAVEALLLALRGTAVLSVGESAEFEARGGLIRFVTEGEKLRFSIDTAAAEKSGLKISAQLLKLARRPRGGP